MKDEFVAGSHAAYAKNPDYVPRQEPPDWMLGGKVAHFDRIEWQIIPDSATAAAALQAGEVDWYEQVQADLVPLLRQATATSRIGSHNPHRLQSACMRFNHLHPPFNDVRMRRAVMMAVNQADYMRSVTGDDPSPIRPASRIFRAARPMASEVGADGHAGRRRQGQGDAQGLRL